MGTVFSSTSNEAQKRSNVKLQAQQVPIFNGNPLMWHTWKKKTRAAVGTAGMLSILDDEEYAERNPVDNETIYHLLQVATSDGNAAHLVDKYEDEKDGRKAFTELQAWYEGDELTTETAEDVRSKLDKLALSTRTTASEYINNFQMYTKQLKDLGESYTTSKTVSIFLDQISDPDYTSTKELCIENQHTLEECIARTRAKERRLDREKLRHNRRTISVRRSSINEKDHQDNPDEYDLSKFLTDKGYYSIPTNTWKSLSMEDREKIKEFNGLLRKKRKNSDEPDRINNRRAPHQEKNVKKRKTVQFNEEETQEDPTDDDTPSTVSEEDVVQINNRRHILTFSSKNE